VAQTALTSRRSANGRGARLAAFLSSLVFAFALGIGAFQHYSYEITPILWDDVDDDATASFLCALPNDGIHDFSKYEKRFAGSMHERTQSRAGEPLSVATRFPLAPREQHPTPLKRLPSAERRAPNNSSIDPD
jgi:hypothetical protein